MFSFTDYCPTFEIQQIVNDGNVAEEKKLCVEITLSDTKVRTYSIPSNTWCVLLISDKTISSVCRLFGANWCIEVLTWKIDKMAI